MVLVLFRAESATIDEYRKRCKKVKDAINYVEQASLANSKKRLSEGDHILKEISQLQDARYTNSLRRELFDGDDEQSGLRRRVNVGEDMNKAMKHYADIQEKLAEDMLMLTRNLKEQTETASKIIRKDTEVRLSSCSSIIIRQPNW